MKKRIFKNLICPIVLLILNYSVKGQDVTITVDTENIGQEVIFGGDGKLTIKDWAEKAVNTTAQKLFGDMNLEILRVPIFALQSIDDPIYDNVITVINAVKAVNPDVKIFASIANGDGYGNHYHGTAKFPSNWQGCCSYNVYSLNLTTYAAYLDSFMERMSEAGITVDYLGPWNEDPGDDSDHFKVFNQMTQLGSAKRVGLERWGLGTSVNDIDDVEDQIDIAGSHFYDDATLTDWDGTWSTLVNTSAVPVWYTESTRYSTNDNIDLLIAGMDNIFPSIRAGAEAVIFYQVVKRFVYANGGSLPIKYSGFKNIVNNAENKNVVATTSTDSDVSAVSFSNGDVVSIHIINKNTSSRSTDINLQNGRKAAGTVMETLWDASNTEISSNYNLTGSASWNVTLPATSYVNIVVPLEPKEITWSTSEWSYASGPNSEISVIIDDNYDTQTDGSLELNNLTVNTGKTLTINAGTSLIVDGDIQNNGSITIESGGSLLTYDGAVHTGNSLIIKRSTRYSDGKYSFVGSPIVSNPNTIGSDLGTWVYEFNESTAHGSDGLMSWVDASSTQLVAGKGYAQAGQKELVFEGVPNAGTITYTGSYTQDTDDDYEGWNLVANPYTSAIELEAFLTENTNITGAVYIWDDDGSDEVRGSNSDYVVANASGATNTTPAGGQSRFNGYIGSMQGFFVKLIDGESEDIVFTENMRADANNADENYFRQTAQKKTFLNLTSSNGLFKQTLIAWNTNVDDQKINPIYDAPVFDKNAKNGIYSKKSGLLLAIQTVSYEKELIPLGLNLEESNSYTIALDDHKPQDKLYLLDKEINRIIDLTETEYTFYANSGNQIDRFELLTSANEILSTAEVQNDWSAHFHSNILFLSFRNKEVEGRKLRIYKLSGQLVLDTKAKSQINLSVTPGVYLVTDGQRTQKFLVER